MDGLAEKRVYAGRDGARELVVAASLGLVVVSLAGGRVGEFGLARRCTPADLAVAIGSDGDSARLAAATDADVMVASEPEVDALEPTDFGPAIGVTFHDDQAVAAAPGGRLAVHENGAWTTLGELAAAPTALDGDLVATAGGVVRVVEGALHEAGLREVNDVARVAGVPLAATADGLYELGNGWLDVLAGDIRLVAGAPDGRAHAATADAFYERADGGWRPVDLPLDGPVAAVAYGERSYAVTAAGDLLVEADDNWRAHPLGVAGVVAAVAT